MYGTDSIMYVMTQGSQGKGKGGGAGLRGGDPNYANISQPDGATVIVTASAEAGRGMLSQDGATYDTFKDIAETSAAYEIPMGPVGRRTSFC